MGSLVLLLGFSTLGCGCVIGRYREVATRRELAKIPVGDNPKRNITVVMGAR